jgi:FixJ family two-component response regulator/DNA-binding MarR family transcriptional regulator
MQTNNVSQSSVAGLLHTGWTVLVVDDDQDCLDEYREAISNLGYAVRCSESTPAALSQISKHPDIGIVLTDLKMPEMDGNILLSEIAIRFKPYRPIVTLVTTGHSSLNAAVLAMQSQASDFLTKPVSMPDLASALLRASAKLSTTTPAQQAAERLNSSASREDTNPSGASLQREGNPSEGELRAFIKLLFKYHHNKAKFFDPATLAGPSWEILLDLAEASLRGEPVPASSASAATLVPLSTALRHVNNLVEAGLVRRWVDPSDKRRTLLELEPEAKAAMQSYLETAWKFQPQPI